MEVKIGIVGFGGMGLWHFENGSKIEGINYVGAFDIADDRKNIIGEEGLKNYSSYEDLLADEEINTVLIATPNHLHKEMTIQAAEAGKNIICEKPVALNVAELDEMIESAKKNNVIFTVHQNRRWDKDFATVKEVLDSGTLGDVYALHSRLHGVNGLVHDWHVYKKYGGGMLYDWGVHLVDQVLQLYPENEIEVFADLRNIINFEVDDYFHIVLKVKNGPTVHIELGTYILKNQPRWSVYGNSGTLTVDSFLATGEITHTSKVLEKLPPKIAQTAAGPTRAFAPPADGALYEEALPTVQSEWTDFYKNFYTVLNGKEEIKIKISEVRKVLSLMECIFEASEEGSSIHFNYKD